ncbi:MAG: C2 domain-containing protein [Planctomycetota bacterium]|jgi:hypothetical protein
MRYLWIAATSLVVVVAAGLPFLVGRGGESGADREPAAEPARVAEGEHYYVLLTVVEVMPRDGEDETWDVGDEAPDLFYEIRWQGQRVFESSTKEDTLVAKWSNVAVALSDVVDAVSLDDAIKAARITARGDGELEFAVYDRDVGRDDLVGRWTVPVEELREGDQRWERPAGRLVSATCRVLALDDVGFKSLTR